LRILDLGCGSGKDLSSWGVTGDDTVVALDLNYARLAAARNWYPSRTLQAAGENLPYKNASFDRVISGVALPYMNISRTLTEINRVLVAGGSLSLTLHLPRFTISELFHQSLPHPVRTLFRLYVLANGLCFHCTGKTISLCSGKTESFQTESGMRIALRRAGFTKPTFHRATEWITNKNHPERRTSESRAKVMLLLCSTGKTRDQQ
jgi:ubiquinone/menaquinone biosynthesis C-methylase UbiE